MSIGRDAEVERLMKLLREYERRGRFGDIPLLLLAQALVPAVDPFVFLRTPTPVSAEWPIDEELEKLLLDAGALKAGLRAVCMADLGAHQHLVAAMVTTFSGRHDVSLWLDHAGPSRSLIGLSEPPSVPNGRSFLMYALGEISRSRDRIPRSWLTERIGGMFMFIGGTVELFPSRVWVDRLGWTPSARDPLVWMRDSKRVAWFERRLGPVRRIYPQDFVYRHPVMNRWVCEADEWHRLADLLGHVPTENVQVEVGTLGRHDD